MASKEFWKETIEAIKDKKKEDTKLLLKLYFRVCTYESMFWNGKMNPTYFKLRAHFNKQEPILVGMLIKYLEAIDGNKHIMTLSELYKNAKQWFQEENQKLIKEETNEFRKEKVLSYKPFSVEDVLNI